MRELFVQPDGYVWTRKGKYGTLVHEIDYFKEYCAYARREGLANPLIVSTALERLTMARKNAKAEQKKEYAQFQDDDRKHVLLQSTINAFKQSKKAKRALADLKSKNELSKLNAINARNYTITMLLIENISRPSELDSLTLASLDEAKTRPQKDDNDGGVYFSVCSTTSKNVSSSGNPAYILITKDMMVLLDQYRSKSRSVLATAASRDALFLKGSGEPMDHDNISQA